MRAQIEVEASIRDRKVVTKNLNLAQKFNTALYVMLIAAGLGFVVLLPLVLTIKAAAHGRVRHGLQLLNVIALLVGTLIVHSLLREDKLKRVTGNDAQVNKKLIAEILKRQFNTESMVVGEKLITLYKRASLINFGTRVIVLFDGKEVLINIARFNYYGLKSFFHGFFSDRKINAIIKEFNEALASSTKTAKH